MANKLVSAILHGRLGCTSSGERLQEATRYAYTLFDIAPRLAHATSSRYPNSVRMVCTTPGPVQRTSPTPRQGVRSRRDRHAKQGANSTVPRDVPRRATPRNQHQGVFARGVGVGTGPNDTHASQVVHINCYAYKGSCFNIVPGCNPINSRAQYCRVIRVYVQWCDEAACWR